MKRLPRMAAGLLIGLVLGATLGCIAGIPVGALVDLFGQAAVNPVGHQVIGAAFGLLLGASLGAAFFAVGPALDAQTRPAQGAVIGAVVGLVCGVPLSGLFLSWSDSDLTTILSCGAFGLADGAAAGMISGIIVAIKSGGREVKPDDADKRRSDEIADFYKRHATETDNSG
jgi:hypothetical protein